MAGKYLNIRDMLDGGGAGASGSEFKGGAMSNILNALGVKPAGYRDRAGNMGQMAPQRPARVNRGPAPAAAPSVPVTAPGGTNPVTPYGESARFNQPMNTPAAAFTRKEPMLNPVVPPMAAAPVAPNVGPVNPDYGMRPALPQAQPNLSMGKTGDETVNRIYNNLLSQGYLPQEINRAIARFMGQTHGAR